MSIVFLGSLIIVKGFQSRLKRCRDCQKTDASIKAVSKLEVPKWRCALELLLWVLETRWSEFTFIISQLWKLLYVLMSVSRLLLWLQIGGEDFVIIVDFVPLPLRAESRVI